MHQVPRNPFSDCHLILFCADSQSISPVITLVTPLAFCVTGVLVAHLNLAAHRDGPFVRTDDERSVYTVMVYLNDPDQYTGGGTVFYSGSKSGDLTPERGEEVAEIRGVQGSGLVFQHEMFHAVRCFSTCLLKIHSPCTKGSGVTGGVKYILRTDMMFVRVATSPLSSALRYADERKYQEAEKLYQESIMYQTLATRSIYMSMSVGSRRTENRPSPQQHISLRWTFTLRLK